MKRPLSLRVSESTCSNTRPTHYSPTVSMLGDELGGGGPDDDWKQDVVIQIVIRIGIQIMTRTVVPKRMALLNPEG